MSGSKSPNLSRDARLLGPKMLLQNLKSAAPRRPKSQKRRSAAGPKILNTTDLHSCCSSLLISFFWKSLVRRCRVLKTGGCGPTGRDGQVMAGRRRKRFWRPQVARSPLPRASARACSPRHVMPMSMWMMPVTRRRSAGSACSTDVRWCVVRRVDDVVGEPTAALSAQHKDVE